MTALLRPSRRSRRSQITARTRAAAPHADPALGSARIFDWIQWLEAENVGDRRTLTLHRDVLASIESTIGALPAEEGGLLGGQRHDSIVRTWHFDQGAARSSATYSPDVATLRRVTSEQWAPAGLGMVGFVHSHPHGFDTPSSGDLAYATAILKRNPALDRLLLPIIQTVPTSGRFSLRPWVAERTSKGFDIAEQRLDIVDDADIARADGALASAAWDTDDTFDRVREAYDIDRLSRCRVVVVGAGGSAQFCDDLARTGVGEFVLIDGDHVEAPNLATQQVYRRDLGRLKVSAVAERIVDVSPHARVATLDLPLDDDFDDHLARLLLFEPLPGGRVPEEVLLCGFTDSFEAQARCNRLALHFGVAYLAAQVYDRGAGVELTYSVPGITPACHRCALGGRYRALLGPAAGRGQAVTSRGTSVFATTALNALKGPVALAMLQGTSDARPGEHMQLAVQRDRLARMGARNLVQQRLDPDIAGLLGLGSFDRSLAGARSDRFFHGDTVWLDQQPEGPASGFDACADCGGSGDLGSSKGTFADTRPMPRAFGDHRRR